MNETTVNRDALSYQDENPGPVLINKACASFLVRLKESVLSILIGMDQCADEYAVLTQVAWILLDSAEKEVLQALIMEGPLWDGDVPSKSARDALLILKLASRACIKGEQGYTVANYRGWDVWQGRQREQSFL